MNLSKVLATHLRSVFFGGNWTDSNVRDQLQTVSLSQAKVSYHNSNSILALTYHIGYYISGVLEVFEGRPLSIRDQFSYVHPEIHTEADWQKLLENIWNDTSSLAAHVEKLPESSLWQDFTDKKYGNYYDNITGIIEHTHYHLGQIAILKKIFEVGD